MIPTCIFCRIINKKDTAHIVYEDDSSLAFLDKYPQTRGHIQLIPKMHVRWVYDIPKIGEFFSVAQQIIHAIIPVLEASHVTIGSFGQEVSHAHLWIVPQYGRDRSVIEGKREQAESQEEVAKMIREGIKKLSFT